MKTSTLAKLALGFLISIEALAVPKSAHLAGEIPKALGAKAAELLAKAPVIEKVDRIAVKQ